MWCEPVSTPVYRDVSFVAAIPLRDDGTISAASLQEACGFVSEQLHQHQGPKFAESVAPDGRRLMLVSNHEVSNAYKDWVRDYWESGSEDRKTGNRLFHVPVAFPGATPVPTLRISREAMSGHGSSSEALIDLLAGIVSMPEDVIRHLPKALAAAMTPGSGPKGVRDVWRSVFEACRVLGPMQVPGSALVEAITSVYNERATPTQRRQMLRFLDGE